MHLHIGIYNEKIAAIVFIINFISLSSHKRLGILSGCLLAWVDYREQITDKRAK